MKVSSMSRAQQKNLLGWKRNREYKPKKLFSSVLSPNILKIAASVTSSDWPIEYKLDQGNTPHCVGFACAHRGIAMPVFQKLTVKNAHDIYYKSVAIGGEPNTENGSTTPWGAEAMVALGYYKDFAMTYDFDDLLAYLLVKGPVVVGIPWMWDDFYTDSTGLIPGTGGEAGGHEICLTGANKSTSRIKFAQSWGEWGLDGFGYMTFKDIRNRIENLDGDACTPVEPGEGNIPVTNVVVSPHAIELAIGETAILSATVSPGDATNMGVTWTSSNPMIVTVGVGGKVTAISSGTASVTVKTTDGGLTDYCAVTVTTVPLPGGCWNTAKALLGL
jgi:uncharacterized protein YjdB